MKKIISYVIPFLPILAIYKSPIPKTNLGVFTFIIVMLLLIVTNKNNKIKFIKRNESHNFLLFYCFYILLLMLISVFLFNNANLSTVTIFLRCSQFIILVFLVSLAINNNWIDYNESFKILKIITIISSIMIILQTLLFYVFHINIYGVLFNYILQGDYYSVSYETASSYYLYRPCGFFLEPSGVSAYFSLTLTILLQNIKTKRDYLLCMFITLSMILTTSGQAWLYSIIIWILHLLKMKKLSKNQYMCFLFIVILLPIVLNMTYKIPIVYKTFYRIFDGSLNGGNAVLGRISSFKILNKMSFSYLLFGFGYGNPIPNMYFNSISYTIYCTGIIGLLIILLFFIKLFKKNQILSIFWFISMFCSTTFGAINICFYLPFFNMINKKEVSYERKY